MKIPKETLGLRSYISFPNGLELPIKITINNKNGLQAYFLCLFYIN
jgi:hypothetical protein